MFSRNVVGVKNVHVTKTTITHGFPHQIGWKWQYEKWYFTLKLIRLDKILQFTDGCFAASSLVYHFDFIKTNIYLFLSALLSDRAIWQNDLENCAYHFQEIAKQIKTRNEICLKRSSESYSHIEYTRYILFLSYIFLMRLFQRLFCCNFHCFKELLKMYCVYLSINKFESHILDPVFSQSSCLFISCHQHAYHRTRCSKTGNNYSSL